MTLRFSYCISSSHTRRRCEPLLVSMSITSQSVRLPHRDIALFLLVINKCFFLLLLLRETLRLCNYPLLFFNSLFPTISIHGWFLPNGGFLMLQFLFCLFADILLRVRAFYFSHLFIHLCIFNQRGSMDS